SVFSHIYIWHNSWFVFLSEPYFYFGLTRVRNDNITTLMKIDGYRFGTISVDGNEYSDDLIIAKGSEIIIPWIREKGHLCQKKDIERYLDGDIKKIIFGRGYFLVMKIDDDLRNYLQEKGIEFVEAGSKKAAEIFNGTEDRSSLLFCIHLTC
ncbi:MAG: MTH938/NDUFAF3 family protein, partial [Deltaproteobacteria bacterium]|nr:MTH938/NDUFAF3 family protein [Deltaproteobacteria bacterium]